MNLSTYELYRRQLDQKKIINLLESHNINVECIRLRKLDFETEYEEILKRPQNNFGYFIKDERKRLNNFLILVQLNQKVKIVVYFNTSFISFKRKNHPIQQELNIILNQLRKRDILWMIQKGNYQCFTCKKQYFSSEMLKRHFKIHKENFNYPCKCSDYITSDIRRMDYCGFSYGSCKCKTFFCPSEIRLGYEPFALNDNYFSNQFLIDENQRRQIYSSIISQPLRNTTKDKNLVTQIYQSSICKVLTDGCYDLENHHFRYISLVSQDGNFIDNIIRASEMDMNGKYMEFCQQHKLNVIEYISIIEFFNIRNELIHSN